MCWHLLRDRSDLHLALFRQVDLQLAAALPVWMWLHFNNKIKSVRTKDGKLDGTCCFQRLILLFSSTKKMEQPHVYS